MFDLDPRVDFDEEEFAGVRIDQEFNRTGIVIAGLPRNSDCGIRNRAADRGIEVQRRSNLNHLLMPPLHRAVALIKVQNVAVLIGENLNFDVPCPPDVALQKDRAVAEGRLRFLAGLFEFPGELFGLIDDAHAASAAAEGRFDDQREADILGESARLPWIGQRFVRPRDDRNFGAFRKAARSRLVAQRFEQMRAGSDEGDAGGFASARQRGVLRKEAVPRMDRVDALLFRECDDPIDIEIRLYGTEPIADLIGFIGFEAMQTEAVLFRIDGNRAQAQFGGGAHDADGNFTAV
jgi:hypothetical protein